MAIRKLSNGRWQVDLRLSPDKRVRKQFKTRLEAARFEQLLLSRSESSKEWLGNTDKRRLSDLVDTWFNVHGYALRDGIKRKSKLDLITVALGDPAAKKLRATDFATYRLDRLKSGIAAKTLNNELGYLRAVYNELRSLSEIDYENPLAFLKPLQLQERSLSWLTHEQIHELLQSINERCENPHVYLITVVCLSTGARWSEAENLTSKSLRSNTITFEGTKSGKVRSVPITPALKKNLLSHWSQYGSFTSSLSSFRRALFKTTIVLPRGQASHVLRHSFASHFMQNGGNILTLQKILGHSSLTMTLRYAHLAPEHLTDAVLLNPLVVRANNGQQPP